MHSGPAAAQFLIFSQQGSNLLKRVEGTPPPSPPSPSFRHPLPCNSSPALPRSSWRKESAKFGLESATCRRPAPCESPFLRRLGPPPDLMALCNPLLNDYMEGRKCLRVRSVAMSSLRSFLSFPCRCRHLRVGLPLVHIRPAEGSCCAPAGGRTQTRSDNLNQSASLPLGCDSGL